MRGDTRGEEGSVFSSPDSRIYDLISCFCRLNMAAGRRTVREMPEMPAGGQEKWDPSQKPVPVPVSNA